MKIIAPPDDEDTEDKLYGLVLTQTEMDALASISGNMSGLYKGVGGDWWDTLLHYQFTEYYMTTLGGNQVEPYKLEEN